MYLCNLLTVLEKRKQKEQQRLMRERERLQREEELRRKRDMRTHQILEVCMRPRRNENSLSHIDVKF